MKHNQSTVLVRHFSSSLRLGLALGVVGVFASASFAAGTFKDTYYVNDHLATTVATLDAAGEIAQIESDAFGAQAGSVAKDSRFTGKPYDADMGAYVFPFRNYRSDEARWMSADPSGFPDGVNLRAYAPVPFSGLDSLGLYTLNNSFSPSSIDANYGGHTYRVSSLDVSEIALGGSSFSLLESQYTDIHFLQESGSLSGSLTINNMTPTPYGSDRGGLSVNISFSPSAGGSGVGFIQFVTTNVPLLGQSNPTVDVSGMLAGINPFYDPSNMLTVSDTPKRYLDNAPVDWTAYAILAKRIDDTHIKVYDGIQYSFQIRRLE